jgi:hypothetical protein
MEDNPYAPPNPGDDFQSTPQRVVASPLVMGLGWTAALLFNLIVPVLIGWSLTDSNAKIGALAAIAMILLAGYVACNYFPLLMLFTLRGSIFVGVSQIIPALHLLMGLISLQFLASLGLIPADGAPTLTGFVMGFIMTLAIGLQLLIISLGLGLILRLITPDRWWLAKSS